MATGGAWPRWTKPLRFDSLGAQWMASGPDGTRVHDSSFIHERKQRNNHQTANRNQKTAKTANHTRLACEWIEIGSWPMWPIFATANISVFRVNRTFFALKKVKESSKETKKTQSQRSICDHTLFSRMTSASICLLPATDRDSPLDVVTHFTWRTKSQPDSSAKRRKSRRRPPPASLQFN